MTAKEKPAGETAGLTGELGKAIIPGTDTTTTGARRQDAIGAFVAEHTTPPAALVPSPLPAEPAYLSDAPRPGKRKGGAVTQPLDLVSPDLEQALCAAALSDSAVFALEVSPGVFHDERHAAIWQAGQERLRAGDRIDPVLLGDDLETHGARVTRAYLAHLQALDVTPANAESYAARVLDLARRRRALADLQQGVRVIYGENGSWAGDLARLAGNLAGIAQPAPGRTAPKTGWTMAELLAADFPEPQWAVPGLVPVGLTFLAGRPKVGKSWLALQIAIAKGSGGRVLDKQVDPGKVLYLGLEDNGRRLAERARKQGAPSGATIRFETTWPRLTDGGLDLLTRSVESDGYRLVIVDTLGRAVGRADTNDYGDMTAVLGGLQELAIARDLAVLVVDHHRKGAPGIDDDPVDAIVGSTGKSGAADAVLGLTKSQGKKGARLRVVGRELEELDLVLAWDAVTCCWQYEGTTEEVELQGRRGLVLAVLQESFPEAMTAGQIAKDAMMHREKVIPLLNDLVREGHATREPKQGREQPYRAMHGNKPAEA